MNSSHVRNFKGSALRYVVLGSIVSRRLHLNHPHGNICSESCMFLQDRSPMFPLRVMLELMGTVPHDELFEVFEVLVCRLGIEELCDEL